MLHFPSTNTAAHRPALADVARLGKLLDDQVWAFSNCRVDVPGRPVAEVDWFFYNIRTGSLMLSEWKRFPDQVSFAADTGKPWLLANGASVDNPIEQVARQLDAVRLAIRRSIVHQHFPGFDEQNLNPAQSVYSPQVDASTVIERIRYGKVHGSLEPLAAWVQNRIGPVPLRLPDDAGLLPLAESFCGLFRCALPPELKAKLRASQVTEPDARATAAQRVSAIHREIARLHGELAELTLETVRVPATVVAAPVVVLPATKPPTSAGEHERIKAHVARAFQRAGHSAGESRNALASAWLAVLRDPTLHGTKGISLGLFGSIATPMIKARHGSLQKLVGMQLRKWCVLQAEQAGLQPREVPGMPSNIRVR